VQGVRRWLACALVAACATIAAVPAGAAAPGSEELSWSAISRFGGDADGDGRLDPPTSQWLAGLDVFPVLVRPDAEICAGLGGARWMVDGKAPNGIEVEGGNDCRAVVAVRGEGSHTIEVAAAGRSQTADVVVGDRLIVVVGDSIASGEGNPDKAGGWLDPPCHRSAAAGFQQAATHLSQRRPQRSLTFVSLACSGAEIQEGLLRPYAGVAPDPRAGDYPPQVTRLAQIARSRAGDERTGTVDVVLLSVGANDVHFSAIVKACAAPGDCRAGHQRQVGDDLRRLRDNYNLLGTRLRRAAPAAPVLITEYFDPTHDENGEFCGQSVGFTTRGEARWAFEALLRPLNEEVAAAATRNHWRLVDGIASDFGRRGYCAKAGWVRRLTGSLFSQRDVLGTLHPSRAGHTAIAKRVAPPLARVLGTTVPPWPQAGEESGSNGNWIAVAVATGLFVLAIPPALTLAAYPLALVTTAAGALLALLVLLVVLLATLALRLLRLLRPTSSDPCTEERASPDLSSVRTPVTPRQFALLGGGIAVAIGLALLLAGVAGSSILWVRFWSSRMPPDQSVEAVARSELVATGAQALALFVVLGLVAVGVAWLLDGKGQWVRSTRRGLVAIGLVEMLVAILIGDFPREQGLLLFAGLAAAALLIHFLVDRALALSQVAPSTPLPKALYGYLADLLHGLRQGFWSRLPSRLLRGLPLLLLLVAIVRACSAEGDDRDLFILLPFALAAVLFVAPGGSAAKGVAHGGELDQAERQSLALPRIALALTGVVCILALIVRDEAWLAATAAVATVLGLFCLAVAKASGQRFAPYGLAVLISVPIFGAAASVTRGVAYPELQPAAAILSDGSPLCGVYVGESDGRLWMGRLLLDERGDVNRPRRGDIFSVDSERVSERMLGPLTPVGRVEARAASLRESLLDTRGDEDFSKRWPTCAPPEEELAAPQSSSGWRRELAERYQPELVIDREDGFWPVPVKTLFSMQDRRAAICRQVAAGSDNCLRLSTQGEFPWAGGEGESLEYPAAEGDLGGQHDLMVDALGSADPGRTAAAYYLVSGGEGPKRPITIQYWFFYPYSYQRIAGVIEGGIHEGDFESVSVLLSAKTRQPRYLWLNRHDVEGRIFPWEDRAVEIVDGHPVIHVAWGSHAAYESCGHHLRRLPGKGALDDSATCNDRRQLHLLPEATPLTDLSRVAWGCWRGRFGHVKGSRASEGARRIADAPLSPLWQQEFDGRTWEPCRGIEDPGGREGPGEEVVEESDGVPARLRQGAGRLDPLVDECADWDSPQPTGTYMVACDPRALRSYLGGGLERPSRPGAEIVAGASRSGGSALPALQRDRGGIYLGAWGLTSAKPTVVSVFATCPQGDGIVGARFDRVALRAGQTLRLRDRHLGGQWGLLEGDGDVVARATPFLTRSNLGELKPQPAGPGREVACGG
jgi:lysophospholipase L1-like esterase